MLKTFCLFAFSFFVSLHTYADFEKRQLTIYFSKNSHSLSEKALTQIQEFVNWSDLKCDHALYISGHTDSDGTHEYNDALSRRRAAEVKSFLLQMGSSEEHIRLTFHGERAKVLSELSEIEKSKNRRVTITYEKYGFETLDEMLAALNEDRVNEFNLITDRPYSLRTNEGIKLQIPEEAFVGSNGKVVYRVKVKVTDALEPMAYITSGLTTLSNGRLLETGGMVRIQAFSESGDNLSLAEDKSIGLEIPTDEILSDMELFVSEDGANWTATNVALGPSAENDNSRPIQPIRNYPSFRPPKFRPDISTRPRMPTEPVYPREPLAPDYAVIMARVVAMGTKKKDRQRVCMKRYEKAVTDYEKKMRKYENRLDAFYTRCENYYVSNNSYEDMLAQWEADMKVKKQEFESTVVVEAFKAYCEKYKYKKAAFEKELKAYWVDYDNWLAEKMNIGISQVEGSAGTYVLEIGELGWANCDRYMVGASENMITQTVKTDQEPCQVIFIEDKGRTLVPFNRAADVHTLTVPEGIPGQVIAFKIIEGELHASFSRFSQKPIGNIAYQKMSVLEFKDRLLGLSS